jgi:hypothetical protein
MPMLCIIMLEGLAMPGQPCAAMGMEGGTEEKPVVGLCCTAPSALMLRAQNFLSGVRKSSN